MEKIELLDELPFGEDPTVYIDQKTALHDDIDADACLQKINNWGRFRKFWLDFYAKKINEVNQRCDNNIAYNKRRLRDYFATVPHRTTKAKTQEVYDLPSGKLAVVYKSASLVPDRKAIIDRLKKAGEIEYINVKTSEDLDWKGYKERLFIGEDGSSIIDRETGELVTDVTIERPMPEFKATPKTAKGEDEDGRDEAREEAV